MRACFFKLPKLTRYSLNLIVYDLKNNKQNYRIVNSNFVITKNFIGKKLKLWRGNMFTKDIIITERHVGLVFGEFCLTRKLANHEGKRKKKNIVNKKKHG